MSIFKLSLGGTLSSIVGALVLTLSPLAPIPANLSPQENEEKLSTIEEQEVREFARRFAARIEKTRDLTPYLNNEPARSLFDKSIVEPEDSTFIDRDVVSKVGNYQLRRFYIAMLNVAYLGDSYVFGRFLLQKTSVRDLSPQQQFPSHVARLMKRNPTLRQWWGDDDSWDNRVTSVAQFYSLLNTFNRAATAMRAHFKRYPPESTAIYKQNVIDLVPFLKEITVDTCNSEKDCGPLPLRTQTIKVNLPAVQLHLMRLDGRLQVMLIGIHRD